MPKSRLLISAIPLLFLAVFFLYPLWCIFALAGSGGLTAILGDRYYLRVIGFSAWLGVASTALTLVAALPGAYVFARVQFRGKTLLRALATVPFVLPTVVVAAAFGALLGPRGLANTLLQTVFGGHQPLIQIDQAIWLVLAAHVFYNYSIVLRIVGGFWAGLDTRLEQAAAVLGANRWRVFREVTLPLLLPAIGAAALLVFIFCFASFGIVLILGGARMATVEVEIYRQTAQFLRLDIAAALALVQMLATLAMTLLYTRLQSRATVTLAARATAANQRPPRTLAQHVFVAINIMFLLLLIGTPLVALALRSVTAADGTPTLQFYRLLNEASGSLFFVAPSVAVRNSLVFALATVVLSMLVGVPAAYLLAVQGLGFRGQGSGGKGTILNFVFSTFDALFTLPLGTSAVTLGLGYIVAFGPWGTLGSPLMVPVAHTLLAFPFVVRGLLPALRALDPRMREAAQVLGARPWRVLREVDLPLLAPALLAGAIYAFTVSLGDFGAVLLLGQADYPTVPFVIYRLLGRPGSTNYGQAMALCTVMMLVSASCFVLLERARPAGSEL